jgi:amidohydrolase
MPDIDVTREVQRRIEDLIALRRDFHRHPELSFAEERTAGIISDRLQKLGYDRVERVAGTGMVGVLRGGEPGKTLLIRADIDALPIQEANDVDYRSQEPGKMHACGHDGHTAIGLVVADVLAQHRAALHGTVKLAFQPAEERIAGAQPMVEAGVMRDPDVDAVIGLHIWNNNRVGTVGVHAGPIFASADGVTFRVRGRGGHGAMPHLNIDPIVAAAQIVIALQTLVSREISPLNPAVVTIGSIHGGTAFNVVADEVEMQGTVRAFAPEDRELLVRRVADLARDVAHGLRAECQVEMQRGCPPCINDPAISEIVRRAAVATVGEANIDSEAMTTGSDDMAYFLNGAPGCYFLVGSQNPAKGCTAPHHSARFNFDEDALPIGASVLLRSTLEYLG